MKTKVELTKEEIEEAIGLYIRNFKTIKVEFKIKTKTHGGQRESWITNYLEGAIVTVEPKKKAVKKKTRNQESPW